MRNTLLLAALASMLLGTGCAAYGALGESLVPYQGRSLHQAGEFRLGVTLQQFPHWAVAYAHTHWSPPFDSAAFVEPTCYSATPAEIQSARAAGCRPHIAGDGSALEVQYRWNPTRSVHPLASVALGSLTSGYRYRTRSTFFQQDSAQSSPFVTLGGGGEVNLARWLHVNVVAGYRESFRKTIPNGTASNSGFTLTSLLIVGWPYRDP